MKKSILILALILCIIMDVHSAVLNGSQVRLDNTNAQERIQNLSSQIDLPYTLETVRLLDVYTHTYIPGARKIVKRGQLYFPIYDHLLNQRGLPHVLKNISIVESNIDPWTFSSRGAVGVWQLMKSTAKAHGLVVDQYVDERFDPVKSSIVAFDYLQELYGEFEDWNMALVAYNFGPTALRKAIRYCQSDEYEIIKEALPKESVKYASRLAAAAYLSSYYEEHNIALPLDIEQVNLATMPVYEYITFDEIAQITGISRQQIIEYNPSISYDYLPANDKGYVINLPLNEMMVLSSQKNWTLSDIEHFEFHKERIEELLVFNSKYEEDKPPFENQNGEAKDDELATDAYRREQVFRLISIG